MPTRAPGCGVDVTVALAERPKGRSPWWRQCGLAKGRGQPQHRHRSRPRGGGKIASKSCTRVAYMPLARAAWPLKPTNPRSRCSPRKSWTPTALKADQRMRRSPACQTSGYDGVRGDGVRGYFLTSFSCPPHQQARGQNGAGHTRTAMKLPVEVVRRGARPWP